MQNPIGKEIPTPDTKRRGTTKEPVETPKAKELNPRDQSTGRQLTERRNEQKPSKEKARHIPPETESQNPHEEPKVDLKHKNENLKRKQSKAPRCSSIPLDYSDLKRKTWIRPLRANTLLFIRRYLRLAERRLKGQLHKEDKARTRTYGPLTAPARSTGSRRGQNGDDVFGRLGQPRESFFFF
ncbi:predicted protein [Arabidopsis lyrata subsp. lyrata]|uniref:Predicted protein n=1 Tax=Arabidopsis lyrata subsp. lyrata TaxID=81972 RepID=D7KFN9_ARALL|nr:predicted protein [Arabidopsis lyrata subsp. lyrata]